MSERIYKVTYRRICRVCGEEFDAKLQHQKTCGKECRLKWQTVAYVRPYSDKIPTGTVGTIGELRVCVDLLSRDYEVFKAVSNHCSCDLAVLKNGMLKRIEVRTGYINKSTGKRTTNLPKDKSQFDVFAI